MSEKRVVMQPAREIHFAGLEPLTHNAGLDISTQQTLTPPSGTNMLLMQTQNQDAVYTIDGTVPIGTGSVIGFLIKADDPLFAIPVGISVVVKVVEVAATSRFQYVWTK